MSVILKRDYNIYISKAPDGSANSTNTVLLNVKDFSWNQSGRVVNRDLKTLNPTQERTVDPYVQAVLPVNFKFTTYISPILDTNVTSPEEYLWVSLMGVDSLTSNPTSSTIDFSNGNVSTLQNLTLWFDNPNSTDTNYRIDNAVVDKATISFDINNIAAIEWKGRALSITQDNTLPTYTDRTAQTECLKNKLSTLSLNVFSTSYDVALVGGQVTIDNKNTYYGRTKLGKTTVPVGHYTGNRKITGDLELYLKTGTNKSGDLLNSIYTQIDSDTYEQTAEATITINIGGTTPYIELNIPVALLDIPNIQWQEAVTMSVGFSAKESTGNYTSVVYFA